VDVISNNHWSNDEDEEDNEHEEVQDRKANNSSPTELRLLKRVNRRPDLTTRNWSQQEVYQKLDRVSKGAYLGLSQNSITEWNLST
jgi:hypothetical protein